jgi:hypothetical protein
MITDTTLDVDSDMKEAYPGKIYVQDRWRTLRQGLRKISESEEL